MAIEIRRFCNKCQSGFTVAVPTKKDTKRVFTCPTCGSKVQPPAGHHSPVREAAHPESGATQQHLF